MEGCRAGGQGQVGQQKVQLYYEERRRTTLPIWVYNLSIMVRVLVEQDSSAETLNTGLNIIYILSDLTPITLAVVPKCTHFLELFFEIIVLV